MKKRITLKDVIKKEMKDAEFYFYFEHARAISRIAKLVKDARCKAGITQTELANKVKTTQTVISRLESGYDKRIPSLDLLERIASALKAKLIVGFEYKKAA